MKRAFLTSVAIGIMLAGCTPGVVRNLDLGNKYPEAAKAKQAVLAGRYQDAEKSYKALSAQDLPNIEKFWVLIDLFDLYYDKLDQPKQALQTIEEAGKLIPENNPLQDEVLYRKGLALEALGKTVDAAKAFEAVATRFPDSPWAQDALDGVERVFEHNFKEYAASLIDPETGDTVYITKLQLDKALDQIPPMYRPKYEKPEGKIELLERILDEELSVLQAGNLGLDTMEKVEKEITRAKINSLMRVYYQKEITEKVQITDKEIKKYYQDHKEDFKRSGKITVKRCVVKDSAKAQELAQAFRTGQNIDSIIKENTLYKHEANRGGTFTAYSTQNAYKTFYESVMALTDSIGVAKVDDTLWAAVKITEKVMPGYKELKEVRTQIMRSIKSEKEREAWEKRRAELRDKFGVKMLIDSTTQELPETLVVIAGLEKAITREDFDAKLSEIPAMFKARYQEPEGRLMLINNMIDEIVVSADADLKRMYLNSQVIKDVQMAKRRAIMQAFYETQISQKVQVSDEEIAQYYKEHKQDYRVPAQVKCKRVVVKSKKQARDILKMYKKGEFTLDSLAKKFSILQGEARRGGSVTVLEKQEPLNFFKAVSKKKPGYKGIVPFADTAWAVVEVEEVSKAKYRTLDEVKPQIERAIRSSKEKDRAFELKDQLKEKYKVVIYIKPKENKENKENKDKTGNNTEDKGENKAQPPDATK